MTQRLGGVIGALGLAMALQSCSKGSAPPAEKAGTVPAMPVTAGYESAIAAHAVKPIFRPKGTAPAVLGPGDRYNLFATGDETNNAFFQFEAIVPAGGGPPPHVHTREDETFYVVSGELELLIGEATYRAKAGDFVFVPRGTVHNFKNVSEGTAIQLVTFVPAGMDGYFKEVFTPVTDANTAPPPLTDELLKKMIEAGAKYGCEFPAAAAGGK